ncbi:hypothetical protein GCM10010251_62570 [Streptomyces aurantiogriseus]|uniref:Uncharacterized protein n=1 Tax=Streptomyces aurantiogriseus TaxID=66870 RepID=A0A918FIG5_9ACTN|nr:hypothetical protein GCM10010251_62570 [Streptomyces aurantiogriseus]
MQEEFKNGEAAGALRISTAFEWAHRLLDAGWAVSVRGVGRYKASDFDAWL